MKILIICSKKFYYTVENIKTQLEQMGHTVFIPNCIKDPESESKAKALGEKAFAEFKQTMYRQSEATIDDVDAVLVLNFNREAQPGYIGGATFIQMYDAFRSGKKIFMWNPTSSRILEDEITGFSPVIIDGDIKLVK